MTPARVAAIVVGVVGLGVAGVSAMSTFDASGTSCGSALARRSVTDGHADLKSAFPDDTDEWIIDDITGLWKKHCDDEGAKRLLFAGAGGAVFIAGLVGGLADRRKPQAKVS